MASMANIERLERGVAGLKLPPDLQTLPAPLKGHIGSFLGKRELSRVRQLSKAYTDREIEILASAQVKLYGIELDGAISDRGAQLLATCFPELESLALWDRSREMTITKEGVKLLAQGKLQTLKSLALRGPNFRDEEIEGLEGAHFPSLVDLDIALSKTTEAALRSIVRIQAPLERVRTNEPSLRDADVTLLCTSDFHLKHLWLSKNVTDASLYALADPATRLRCKAVHFETTPFSKEGIRALIMSQQPIEELCFYDAGGAVMDEIVHELYMAIRQKPKRLAYLKISCDPLSRESFRKFVEITDVLTITMRRVFASYETAATVLDELLNGFPLPVKHKISLLHAYSGWELADRTSPQYQAWSDAQSQ